MRRLETVLAAALLAEHADDLLANLGDDDAPEQRAENRCEQSDAAENRADLGLTESGLNEKWRTQRCAQVVGQLEEDDEQQNGGAGEQACTLKEVAELTGGKYYAASSANDMRGESVGCVCSDMRPR